MSIRGVWIGVRLLVDAVLVGIGLLTLWPTPGAPGASFWLLLVVAGVVVAAFADAVRLLRRVAGVSAPPRG